MRQAVECESLSKETLGARILSVAGKSGDKQNYSSRKSSLKMLSAAVLMKLFAVMSL